MLREKVQSSMIASFGYDASIATLEIEFNSGTVWQYYDVPVKVFDNMKKSSSFGKYFRKYIKDEYQEMQVG